MAEQGVGSSGFERWYQYLRSECKKGVIESLIVAFKNRSLSETKATKYIMSRQHWYNLPLHGRVLTKRLVEAREYLPGMTDQNIYADLQTIKKKESIDSEDTGSKVIFNEAVVIPSEEAQPIISSSEEPELAEQDISPQMLLKQALDMELALDVEFTLGDEQGIPQNPEQRLHYRLQNQCASNEHLQKHIEEARASGMEEEQINAAVREERAIALSAAGMRFFTQNEQLGSFDTRLKKTWQAFGSGGVSVAVSTVISNSETIKAMTCSEKFFALDYLNMKEAQQEQVRQDMKNLLNEWHRSKNVSNHPLLDQFH